MKSDTYEGILTKFYAVIRYQLYQEIKKHWDTKIIDNPDLLDPGDDIIEEETIL